MMNDYVCGMAKRTKISSIELAVVLVGCICFFFSCSNGSNEEDTVPLWDKEMTILAFDKCLSGINKHGLFEPIDSILCSCVVEKAETLHNEQSDFLEISKELMQRLADSCKVENKIIFENELLGYPKLLPNGDSVYVQYRSGKLIDSTEFKNGMFNGRSWTFNDSLDLYYLSHFENDKLHGFQTLYNKDSVELKKGYFHKGNPSGEWIYKDSLNQVRRYEYYTSFGEKFYVKLFLPDTVPYVSGYTMNTIVIRDTINYGDSVWFQVNAITPPGTNGKVVFCENNAADKCDYIMYNYSDKSGDESANYKAPIKQIGKVDFVVTYLLFEDGSEDAERFDVSRSVFVRKKE